MSEDFQNEIEAINSIYGDGSLVHAEGHDIYILDLPAHSTSLRIQFPASYPAIPPIVLGTNSSGENVRKGKAANVMTLVSNAITTLFRPGEVCLFDVVEEVSNGLDDLRVVTSAGTREPNENTDQPNPTMTILPRGIPKTEFIPSWILSDVVIESKSVFVARCAPVTSTHQAKQYLQHLFDTDKKVRSATHNMTAWRVKGENGVSYQDCDDDGETAAGGRLLHLMQLMELWNLMVVVTRWYGGHQLGPKRFSIINAVARDAFVKGSFVKEDLSKRKGKN